MDADDLEFAAELAEMWEHRRGGFAARAATVEAAVVALLTGALEEQQRAEAQREAHKLAGALGTYGVPDGSEIARELEHAFRAQPLEPAGAPRMAELTLALHRTIARGPGDPTPPRERGAAAPDGDAAESDGLLLVLTADDELAERLASEAASRGHIARRPPDGGRAARNGEPDGPVAAALVDLDRPPGDTPALELVEALARGRAAVPTAVLGDATTLDARLTAVRRGAGVFLPRSAPATDVIAALTGMRDRRRTAESRVFVLDDDPAILEAVAALLEPGGAQVTGVLEPEQLWELLPSARPDLLVLDVDMPSADGADLCRVIRGDPRFAELPVLFLTAHTDAGTLQRIFAAGADDYVAKPIVPAEVVGRIHNRMERARLMRQLAERDPLTGVPNRRKASMDVVRSLGLSDRYGQPVSLALLDVDHFKAINDRHGHAVGDAVLRALAAVLSRSFRGEDTVGRWGGEEFVVCLYGAHRDDAVTRIAGILERFASMELPTPGGSPVRATVSAGVAEHRVDADDPQGLHRAADRALHAAKAAGRNRVLPVGWRPEAGQRVVDVAVVEDDDTLADLLIHALETRGYATAHLRDGVEAAAALEGPSARVRARVVLLDVDLPGLDGISLLRRLARGGTLGDLAVIMLTARAAEIEVLEALELGAIDHVAKPFSVPVLLQRVRRALDAPR